MPRRLRTALLSLLVIPMSAGAHLLQDPEPARAPNDDMLFVTDDDRSLELIVAKYLRARDVVARAELYSGDENDVILKLPWGLGEGKPDLLLNLDAQEVARDDDGSLTEQRVVIFGYFTWGVGPDHEQRQQAMELINSYHSAYWSPQRVYIDGDGDLAIESSLNIPDNTTGLPCSIVHDTVLRMAAAADTLADQVQAAGLPPLQ